MLYTYIHTQIHTYTYIHTSYIDETRKPWRKIWFCIQRLNETNQTDAGSTTPTWTTMWLLMKAVSVERLFISLSKFQVPRGGVILCHVRLCKLAKNRKWTCFWCYTQSCYKPLTNLYSSVARTSIFL